MAISVHGLDAQRIVVVLDGAVTDSQIFTRYIDPICKVLGAQRKIMPTYGLRKSSCRPWRVNESQGDTMVHYAHHNERGTLPVLSGKVGTPAGIPKLPSLSAP